ncbi:CHASE3 domain-containing protein [Sphingomonas sp. MMS24-J13]|uniref:sensor histidine kinase n=1 Tax=Sphingomonas sp. MMS24-J13 TaxID=3238686 RepID=UPI00384A8198
MRFSLKSLTVSDRWFNRLVVGAIALGFLALLSAGISALESVRENQIWVRWAGHTYKVEHELSNFTVMVERAETGRRGYLLSGAPNALRTYVESSRELMPSLARIKYLTRDNPQQQANVAILMQRTRSDIAMMEQSVQLMRSGNAEAAREAFRDTIPMQVMRSVREAAAAMTAEENRLLAERDSDQARSLHIFYVTIGVAGIILLVVGSASMWLILRYTRDLTTSRDALRDLNANLEGAVRERTADLQRANEEIQRFAYIVSHDLRAPLVNVMGFTAELETAAKSLARLVDKVEEVVPDKMEREWADAARLDLPEAIGFIRTSTQKMDRLINAILRLSREGRRPITSEQLDLRDVLQGIANSLKHRADELGIEIIVGSPMPDIYSDRLAIEQIFSNIIENATKYLKPGRAGRIEIKGRIERGRIVIEIKDNGRGIDPKDHDRIFDLFRRSGVQDQPGEGIGLAHTRALAYRLGGTINVESQLGEGATFRVNLPRIYAGEQGASS